jgi:glycosyltransferase involved in cell wall biosynthesis
MRILIITNFYPPSRSWGYTQLCQEVAENLSELGHALAILTSNHQANRIKDHEPSIYRLLHIESDPFHYKPLSFFTTRRRYINKDLATTQYIVQSYQPDLIFIWGMWNMSMNIPAFVETLDGHKVVYYLSDHWPTFDSPHLVYWRMPGQHVITRPIKAILNRFALYLLSMEKAQSPLKFEHPICVSHTLKDRLVEKGVPVHHAKVIYNGIDETAFGDYVGPIKLNSNKPLRLIVAGRLSPDKGIHTAIESISHLVHEHMIKDVHLTIVGDGDTGYQNQLLNRISGLDLNKHIKLSGRIDRLQMPTMLKQFDILVFPSISAEALPRMPQEAMACGLTVVGTETGGTKELIFDEINGLTFKPEDSKGLARQIARLHNNPELRWELSKAGRLFVREKFTLKRMIKELEDYLYQVVASD